MGEAVARGQHPGGLITNDILIRGGLLFDGAGSPGVIADLAIRDGRIAAIGRNLTGDAAKTIDAAVREAYAAARPGDTVLLAPACASFDQFDNFEHRGRVFKSLVAQLEPKR